MFAFIDTDHDGYLTVSELVGYLGKGQATLAQAIILEADTDLDGRVSAEEFRTAYHLIGTQVTFRDVEKTAVRRQEAPFAGGKAGVEGGSDGPPGTAVAVGEAGGNANGGANGVNPVIRMTSVTSVMSTGDELTRKDSTDA